MNSITHLCFVHTFMSDAVLLDCQLLFVIMKERNFKIKEYCWECWTSIPLPLTFVVWCHRRHYFWSDPLTFQNWFWVLTLFLSFHFKSGRINLLKVFQWILNFVSHFFFPLLFNQRNYQLLNLVTFFSVVIKNTKSGYPNK